MHEWDAMGWDHDDPRQDRSRSYRRRDILLFLSQKLQMIVKYRDGKAVILSLHTPTNDQQNISPLFSPKKIAIPGFS